MLARLNIRKIHTSATIAGLSLLGFFIIPASNIPAQQTYQGVQSRQVARQALLLPTVRPGIESKESEHERKNAPKRLDLLAGASGQPLDEKRIFPLSSSMGTGFGKLVPEKNGYGLAVKEPAGTWLRIPVAHFEKTLVLMRHGKSCVRLEDPVEPTANYYAICLMPEGITIHTVGELESFS